ncbi:hypothetical protein [Hyunsoonleella ulvae]|uniref:hypothetical protein n=1 Tax=Hyunsoonleella ulvae TaxID=2799948 RepID=UPI00193A0D42|nr:hypothetical protein [Hyunsoonleella ulvae]
MKKTILSAVIFLFTGIYAFAQVPTWSVNENDFEYNMSFVAFLNIDGVTLSSTNDMIGAFVNDECRGVANLIYVASKDRYYAYFNVFSNTNGEAISFKVYDSANDKVVDISKTINFQINALFGDIAQAYSFASPELNNGADLLNFGFKDVTINNRINNGNDITLFVDNSIDISALTPVFQLSPGAQLYQNAMPVISDNDVLDFTNTQAFDVVSEDESSSNRWQITVKYNASIGDLAFYKKDAVCYNGGAIKVVSSQNGSNVVVLKDQSEFATQQIINGEALFSNLSAGNYLLKINGLEKEIEISLKE